MKISLPSEVKNEERRVAATPETVKKMVSLGWQVVIQKGAGERVNISDEAYQVAGAKLVLAQGNPLQRGGSNIA